MKYTYREHPEANPITYNSADDLATHLKISKRTLFRKIKAGTICVERTNVQTFRPDVKKYRIEYHGDPKHPFHIQVLKELKIEMENEVLKCPRKTSARVIFWKIRSLILKRCSKIGDIELGIEEQEYLQEMYEMRSD